MGTKRSGLTDENGLPLSVVLSGANTHDVKLLEETLDHSVIFRPEPEEGHPQNRYFIVLPLKKPCNIRRFRLLNPQTVCTFPCFFPYGLKQGKVFYSPLTTLSSSRAELRFASLVEWA